MMIIMIRPYYENNATNDMIMMQFSRVITTENMLYYFEAL